jgi:hypothetical protein
MRIREVLALACSIMACMPTAASAQEPKTGITMGYPASIGLLWHVSDRVALRPEFSFTRTDSSSESLINDESNFWSLGTGASVLLYAPLTDNLRTYLAPRFSYAKTTGDTNTTESTTHVYTIAGMFGAQYSLGRRFAAFGEVGFGYSRQNGSSTTTIGGLANRVTNRGNAVGTRTGAGVIFYF